MIHRVTVETGKIKNESTAIQKKQLKTEGEKKGTGRGQGELYMQTTWFELRIQKQSLRKYMQGGLNGNQWRCTSATKFPSLGDPVQGACGTTVKRRAWAVSPKASCPAELSPATYISPTAKNTDRKQRLPNK